jgi:hypothetical protein
MCDELTHSDRLIASARPPGEIPPDVSALARRFGLLLREHRMLAALDECISPDVCYHLAWGERLLGLRSVQQFLACTRREQPIEMLLARSIYTGTTGFAVNYLTRRSMPRFRRRWSCESLWRYTVRDGLIVAGEDLVLRVHVLEFEHANDPESRPVETLTGADATAYLHQRWLDSGC